MDPTAAYPSPDSGQTQWPVPRRPIGPPYISPEDLHKVDGLVTQDNKPVDSFFAAKQMRLLVEPLYASWRHQTERPFLVDADVGLFYSVDFPPLVPDVFLSLDVELPRNWDPSKQRSYFFWDFKKPPDVVIEIVSDRRGGEDSEKLNQYAWMGIGHYCIFDPLKQLSDDVLRMYLLGEICTLTDPHWLPAVGIGLMLWDGEYEGERAQWLRWCDRAGDVIATGAERAENLQQRADRLAAQLRALGAEPQD